jgi:flagellar biosynthetic protein FliP
MMRGGKLALGGALVLMLVPIVALAQQGQGVAQSVGDSGVTGNIIQMAAVLTVMSALPALLVMTTSFTRFLIAFSFLRAGLGLQGAPANLVLISLALFMTFHVMAPTLDKAWQEGGKPLIEKRITEEQAFERVMRPFREFMLANVREKDLELFRELSRRNPGGGPPTSAQGAEVELRVLVPAFMISELRRGFEIGFLIILPFLVIDLIVATIVMSMGMMMVSPTVFSLPCKVLFFVLIDGWNLLVGGLVRSFQ